MRKGERPTRTTTGTKPFHEKITLWMYLSNGSYVPITPNFIYIDINGIHLLEEKGLRHSLANLVEHVTTPKS